MFTVGDYTLFLTSWNKPAGGIHGYLNRFLASGDPTFQHIAIWTLLQLIESGDTRLLEAIKKSEGVINMVRDISEKPVESGDEVEDGEDGEGEVVALARRCLEMSGVDDTSARSTNPGEATSTSSGGDPSSAKT